jgi:hypothetical protein
VFDFFFFFFYIPNYLDSYSDIGYIEYY